MEKNQKLALERLIQIAKRDTGQCRRVANFLLSWWNAEVCGTWNITDVWSLDRQITQDILTVLGFLAQRCVYPDRMGYGDDFQEIFKQWRPKLFKELTEANA